ncbi:hypothetical protein CC79DRAFT_1364672 [Sarocladium strictum]
MSCPYDTGLNTAMCCAPFACDLKQELRDFRISLIFLYMDFPPSSTLASNVLDILPLLRNILVFVKVILATLFVSLLDSADPEQHRPSAHDHKGEAQEDDGADEDCVGGLARSGGGGHVDQCEVRHVGVSEALEGFGAD